MSKIKSTIKPLLCLLTAKFKNEAVQLRYFDLKIRSSEHSHAATNFFEFMCIDFSQGIDTHYPIQVASVHI